MHFMSGQLTTKHIKWMGDFFGADEGIQGVLRQLLSEQKPPGGGGPDPWAGSPAGQTAQPVTAALPPAGGSADAMSPNCKPVRGKVKGPEHHLLCATHGHVLDMKAKKVIAKDLEDYAAKFRHSGHTAGPSSAAVQGGGVVAGVVGDLGKAMNVVGEALAKGAAVVTAPPDKDTKDRLARIETGKSLVANAARDYVMAKYSRITNLMVRWQNDQMKLLRKEEAAESGLGETLLKLTKLVDIAVLIIFPEIEAVKLTVEAADKAIEVVETATSIAEAEKKKAEAAAAAAAIDQIGEMVNGVLAKENYLRAEANKVIDKMLDNLDSDAKVADQLATNSDKEIRRIVTDVMHIQDADAVGSAIVKLHNALDKEMAAWRKRTAVNKKIKNLPPMMQEALRNSPEYMEKLNKEYDEEHEED
jgi:hypothetical protein